MVELVSVTRTLKDAEHHPADLSHDQRTEVPSGMVADGCRVVGLDLRTHGDGQLCLQPWWENIGACAHSSPSGPVMSRSEMEMSACQRCHLLPNMWIGVETSRRSPPFGVNASEAGYRICIAMRLSPRGV